MTNETLLVILVVLVAVGLLARAIWRGSRAGHGGCGCAAEGRCDACPQAPSRDDEDNPPPPGGKNSP